MSSQLPLSPPNSPRISPTTTIPTDAKPKPKPPKRPPPVTLLRATVDRSNRWRAERTVWTGRDEEDAEVVKRRKVEDVEVRDGGDGGVGAGGGVDGSEVRPGEGMEGKVGREVTRTAESQTAAGFQTKQCFDENISPISPADDARRREDEPESIPPSEESLRPDWLADVLGAADRVAGSQEGAGWKEGPVESAKQERDEVSDTKVTTKRAAKPRRRQRLHLFDSDDDEPDEDEPPKRLVLATDESDDGEDNEPSVEAQRPAKNGSKANEDQPSDRSDATQKTTEESQEQLKKLKEFFAADEGPCFDQQMLPLYEPEPERRKPSPSPAQPGQPPPDRFRTISVEPPPIPGSAHDHGSEWESDTDETRSEIAAERSDHIVLRVVEVKVERLSPGSPDMAHIPRTPTPPREYSEESENIPQSSPWPKTPIKEESQQHTWPDSFVPSSSSLSSPLSPPPTTQPNSSPPPPRRRRLRRYASLERLPQPEYPEIQVPATSEEDFSPPLPAFLNLSSPRITSSTSPPPPSSPPRLPRKTSPIRIPKKEKNAPSTPRPGVARVFRRRQVSPSAPSSSAPLPGRRTRDSLAPSSTQPSSHTSRLLASLSLTPTRALPLSVLLTSIPPAILHSELLRLNKFFTLGRPAEEIPETRLDFPRANYDTLWGAMQDLAGLWCACVLGKELPVVGISEEEYRVLEGEEEWMEEWVKEVRRRVGAVTVGRGARRRGWDVRVMEVGEVKRE